MRLEQAEIDAIADAVVLRLEKSSLKPNSNRLLDKSAAAVMLGRSKAAVSMLVARGRLATVRDGSRVYVELAEIERFMERNRRTS